MPHHVSPGSLVEAMRRDKKRRSGRLRFVLLREIGDVIVTDDVSRDDLLAVLDSLNP